MVTLPPLIPYPFSIEKVSDWNDYNFFSIIYVLLYKCFTGAVKRGREEEEGVEEEPPRKRML